MSQNDFKIMWYKQFIDTLLNVNVHKDIITFNAQKPMSTEQKYSMLHDALTDAWNYAKLQKKYDMIEADEPEEEDYL